jgi:bis(5'-nucleosyl)-tetraphosphatase (symmetrical)
MATYIVGDIQGCFNGLQRLLKKVAFSPLNDRLIAVGDLIGRGPEPLQTLDYLQSLENRFDTVLGNHDLHLLAIYANVRQAKKNDNLDSLLNSPSLETHINWLRKMPLALMADNNTLVTHAGLYPKWSIKRALKVSGEVSQRLQADDWVDFLTNMYGNQPNIWHKNLIGADRTRFIVNALTRMRFIENQEQLDFNCKVAPESAPDHLLPWFEVNNKKLKPEQQVVFGHWASLNGKTTNKRFIALDTGYIWGQSMTLLHLSSGKISAVKHQE